MLADELDYVIGVDPHRDRHAFAVVRSATGRVVFEARRGRLERRLPVGPAAGRAARSRPSRVRDRGDGLLRQGPGPVPGRSRASGSSRSAGSSATSARPRRPTRSTRSAQHAACSPGRKPAQPRSGGKREALRALTVAREGALTRKACRALPATRPAGHLPRAAPQRAPPADPRPGCCKRLQAVRPTRHDDPELRGTLLAMRAVARRVHQLTVEERELKAEIESVVARARTAAYSPSPASAQSAPPRC